MMNYTASAGQRGDKPNENRACCLFTHIHLCRIILNKLNKNATSHCPECISVDILMDFCVQEERKKSCVFGAT